MFNKLIYVIGIRARNPIINDNYRFLVESQKWNIGQLREYQLARLKVLLRHAYQYSRFYQDKFDSIHIHPDDIVALDDLKRLPVLTKDELLQNAGQIQITSGDEKLFYSETSGSTGKPLVFYRNLDWDAWHRASIYRGYSWYNVKPWERNGYLWGYNFALKKRIKTRFLDSFQNRFRLFSYRDHEIDSFIKKLRHASFLGGYSSMIYEIAKYINTHGIRPLENLKLVKGTSEKIFDQYQSEACEAFGRKITSEYGAAEAGIIAFEPPCGNMHINMETVIVEEEEKQIIVTNLVSKSFPIIRFKLGDYIELDTQTECGCGMHRPIIREVIGRIGKVIRGRNNQYPSLTLYYVFKNLAMEHNLILNYQAVQKEQGKLEVAIENELSVPATEKLLAEFRKYFTDDLDVFIRDKADLKSSNKKKADFISELT
jgi:phenylacetate-CoA ligase